MSQSLNDTFDIVEIPVIEGVLVPADEKIMLPASPIIEENADADYESARSNLHALLTHGQAVLTTALKVVEESESAHSIEVAGSLIKQLAEINSQLLDLSVKRSRIQKSNDKEGGDKTVNAYFLGSTTELAQLIKTTQKDNK